MGQNLKTITLGEMKKIVARLQTTLRKREREALLRRDSATELDLALIQEHRQELTRARDHIELRFSYRQPHTLFVCEIELAPLAKFVDRRRNDRGFSGDTIARSMRKQVKVAKENVDIWLGLCVERRATNRLVQTAGPQWQFFIAAADAQTAVALKLAYHGAQTLLPQ